MTTIKTIISSGVLCFSLLVSTSVMAIPGDLNGDNVVNALDLRVLQMRRLGLPVNTPGGSPDLNQDGATDASDFGLLATGISGQPVIFSSGPSMTPGRITLVGLNLTINNLTDSISINGQAADLTTATIVTEMDAQGNTVVTGVDFPAPPAAQDGTGVAMIGGQTFNLPLVRVPVSVSVAASDVSEENDVVVTLTLDKPAADPVTVLLSTMDGTAVAGQDYEARTDFLVTIPANMTTATTTVVVTDDTDMENTETFSVVITQAMRVINGQPTPDNAMVGMPSSATASIMDNEFAADIDFDQATLSLAEGVMGSVNLVYTTTEGPSPAATTVTVTGTGAGSTADDLVAFMGSVTFPMGTITGAMQPLNLEVLDDDLIEGDEDIVFTFTVSGAGRVGTTTPSLTLTMTDSDEATISFANAAVNVREDAMAPGNEVAVSLVLGLGGKTLASDVTVNVQFDNQSTATNGSDISMYSTQMAQFVAGTSEGASVSVGSITLTNDTLAEVIETVVLSGQVSQGAASISGNFTLSIYDDECPAFETSIASVDDSGTPGIERSAFPRVSADGRFVVFDSRSANLVANDTNGQSDVFVRDLVLGVTTRVSTSSAGDEANRNCFSADISADGRFVVFVSRANNLVANDTNNSLDVFLRDREAGTTTCISTDIFGMPGNADSISPRISADGTHVVFTSSASNLVMGDSNSRDDIFVFDRVNTTMTRVSVATSGTEADRESSFAAISATGQFIVFQSFATNLVANDTNDSSDVFLHDRQNSTTERVSLTNAGAESTSSSRAASVSDSGRFVSFQSVGADFVNGDNNLVNDIFVRDRQNSTTTRVSNRSSGVESTRNASSAHLSGDGRFVTFASDDLLIPGMFSARSTYRRNLETGELIILSVNSSVSASTEAAVPHISQDGRTVVFSSLSAAFYGAQSGADQQVVVYEDFSHLPVSPVRASVANDGSEAMAGAGGAVFSGNGRFVAFSSSADDLVAGDTNGMFDAFVRDLETMETTRVSVATDGTESNGFSGVTSISDDGRYVLFFSNATNLVAGDTNFANDVFLRDRQEGTTTRVSLGSGQLQGNSGSSDGVITPDGRYVAFVSQASNFDTTPPGSRGSIFLRDRLNGTTIRLTVGVGNTPEDGTIRGLRITPDGSVVCFESGSSNLVPNDTNGATDVFVVNSQTQNITRISVSTAGAEGAGSSNVPDITSDGRFVSFQSTAANLVASDTNSASDIFLRDLQTNTTTLISIATSGIQGNRSSQSARMAAGARYVIFESSSSTLIQNSQGSHVYVRDTLLGTTTAISRRTDGSLINVSRVFSLGASNSGRTVSIFTSSSNLVPNDTNNTNDVYVIRGVK